MTDADLTEMAERLRALRDELLDLIRGSAEQTRTVSLDEPIGRLSRMDAMQQQKMAEAQVRLARDRLAAVNQALVRIEKGTYGDCIDCGEAIDVRRMRVKPEGALCLPCQRAREG